LLLVSFTSDLKEDSSFSLVLKKQNFSALIKTLPCSMFKAEVFFLLEVEYFYLSHQQKPRLLLFSGQRLEKAEWKQSITTMEMNSLQDFANVKVCSRH